MSAALLLQKGPQTEESGVQGLRSQGLNEAGPRHAGPRAPGRGARSPALALRPPARSGAKAPGSEPELRPRGRGEVTCARRGRSAGATLRRRPAHPWARGAGKSLSLRPPRVGLRRNRAGGRASRTRYPRGSARHVTSAKVGSASAQVRKLRPSRVRGARMDQLRGLFCAPRGRVGSRGEAPSEPAARGRTCGGPRRPPPRAADDAPLGPRRRPPAPARRGQWKNPAFRVGDPGRDGDCDSPGAACTPPPGFARPVALSCPKR